MNSGYLSRYFDAVAAKTLRAVEVSSEVSHQHELNGTRALKRVIRTTEDVQFPTKFIWMEEENEAVASDSSVSWYNARRGNPNRSAEYRLYFQNNPAMQLAKVGDTMFIARRTDNTLLIVITSSGSTIERQLYWLFNLTPPQGDLFTVSEIEPGINNMEIDFSARFILEELGIEVEEPENDMLDRLLEKFSGKFPDTAAFSSYARETLPEKIDLREDPDQALMNFLLWEEKLFRRLERHGVSQKLKEGFNEDVEGFINYSLSIQNRRKSRAGSSLEEHVAYIFQKLGIHFSKGQKTENKAKPDFIFPNITLYHDKNFPSEDLTMLGAKTSLKDRWRQVLSEAERISLKHLLTLEPGISENQTSEMQAQSLQLVLPKEIHQTFTKPQQSWLINFKEFISLVSRKQTKTFN